MRGTKPIAAAPATSVALGATAAADAGGVEDERVADMPHAVMESDRAVCTRMEVQRLVNREGVVRACEPVEDDSAQPRPAHMFRFGAEMAADKTEDVSYSLSSLWPIDKQNAPGTDVRREALESIADNPGENFHGEKGLGGVTCFTAVHADTGVAQACVSRHNAHKDTPRTDFEPGAVMGGGVIRIPMQD